MSATGLARRRGFTLIEIVAVLAVLALLAAALVPLLLMQLDELARTKEQATLQALGDGLQKYVLRTRTIPSAATLLSSVGAELGLSPNDSLNTARGGSRVVLVDPGLHLGQYNSGSTVTNGLLPYTQANAGSKTPLSPRLLIVSSTGTTLPSSLSNGIPANSVFTNLWGTAPNAIPTGWTWTGQGRDLKIERVNLSQLFVQISLNRFGTNVGRYAFDAGAASAPASNPVSLWVIKGSMLSLYSHTGGSDAITGGLQTTEAVDGPLSFSYDNGTWRAQLFVSMGTRQIEGYDLQTALNTFNQAPENPDALNGTTKAMVYNSFTAYLAAFQTWSAAGYPSGSLKTAVLSAQADLAQSTSRLIKHL